MNQLECPICEFSFGWDTASGLKVTCPCCSKTFSVTAEQLVVQSTPTKLPFPNPGSVKPEMVPTQDAPPEVIQLTPATKSVDLDFSDSRVKRFHHKRSVIRRRIWISLFLLFLSCVAIGFLTHRLGVWNFAVPEKVDSAEDESQTDGRLISDSDELATPSDSAEEGSPIPGKDGD